MLSTPKQKLGKGSVQSAWHILWSESCRLILQRLLPSLIPQVSFHLFQLSSTCVPLVFRLRSGGVRIARHLHSVPVVQTVFPFSLLCFTCVPLMCSTCLLHCLVLEYHCKTDCTCCLQREVHCTFV